LSLREAAVSPAGPVTGPRDAADFYALVSGRRGHFRLESGHHGGLWLDLDPLFSRPDAIEPFVGALADALRPHAPDAVCGPLLGGAFLAQRVAMRLGAEFWHAERQAPDEPSGMFAVRYRLPPPLRARARGARVAIVDDVMSAGSALRGTYAELTDHGALPVAAGALLVLGGLGERFFAERKVPVLAVCRDEYAVWTADHCPRCAAGEPLEEVA
jgi:orotate phosphoribosyltransferase